MHHAAGCGVEATWTRCSRVKAARRKIDTFDVSDIACKIAGVIRGADGAGATYNADQWMEPKEQRKVDEFIVFAMCAARQALDDCRDGTPKATKNRLRPA